MDLGLMMIFASYGWQGMGDDQAWEEDLRLARLAEGSVSMRFGLSSTTSTTIHSAPTICS